MNDTTASSTAVRYGGGTSSWLRFALFCTLFLLAAVCLETFMGPLNRATAVLSGKTLSLLGFEPQVRGDLITLAGFTVKIVSECTALYATLMLAAFILATPATWRERLAGIVAGSAAIGVANLLRIAAVTIIGTVDPVRFEIIHVYLGQMAMMLLVVYCCLTWVRWSSGKKGNNTFLFLALCWSSILFLPWLFLHKFYLSILDLFVSYIFSVADSHHVLTLTLQNGIFNHPFSVPFYLSLLLASTGVSGRRRVIGAVIGVSIISAGHTLFRVTHVLVNMSDLEWVSSLHTLVYLLGQFLLPVLIWLWVVDFTPNITVMSSDGDS